MTICLKIWGDSAKAKNFAGYKKHALGQTNLRAPPRRGDSPCRRRARCRMNVAPGAAKYTTLGRGLTGRNKTKSISCGRGVMMLLGLHRRRRAFRCIGRSRHALLFGDLDAVAHLKGGVIASSLRIAISVQKKKKVDLDLTVVAILLWMGDVRVRSLGRLCPHVYEGGGGGGAVSFLFILDVHDHSTA